MNKSVSKKKVVVTTTKKAAPTVSKAKSTSASPVRKGELIFGKKNYMLMLAGLGLIALGLLLMSGGHMPSPDVWDESIIYSNRRIVLGPMVILLGLIVEIVAIFRNPGVAENPETNL